MSIRLPLSLAKRLDDACKKRGVAQSALVRDFISLGLKNLDSAGLIPQKRKSGASPASALNPFEDLSGSWTYGTAEEYLNEIREGWD